MASPLVVAPLLVALVSIVATLTARRWPRVQRSLSVLGAATYAVTVAVLAWRMVLAPNPVGPDVYQVGGWEAPYGITLVTDSLSMFFLVMAAAVGLAAVAFSVAFIDRDNQRVFYHPLFHCLLLGVTGAVLTGDMFNLFVWFEVMLMASYVFVAFYGGPRHTASALRYLVLNVVGSVVMLLGIGGLYATTGTLNMADMARRLAEPAAYGIDVVPVAGLAALLFVTFALKAGLVPFQFWVPGAYSAAPLPVTAMLAGVSKKVGLYAIVRLYFTVFDGVGIQASFPGIDGVSPLAIVGPVLFVMAVASVLVGGLGAVSRDSIEHVLAYSSIGQVGFIALPVAIAMTATGASLRQVAVAAALVFALHHALSKGMLFLIAAAVRGATGTNRFAELGGLAGRAPALGTAFFVGSLSLVGIPPLAGFFGKFLVFEVAARQVAVSATAGPVVALVTLLLGSLLTIAYTTRAWTRSFWGDRTRAVDEASIDGTQVAIVAVLAVTVLLVGVAFDPVYEFATSAAEAALDRGAYVELVGPDGGADA